MTKMSEPISARSRRRRRLSAAVFAVLAATSAAAEPADDVVPPIEIDGATEAALGDALLPMLLDAAQRGEGDPHLPYVLHRLEQAMSAQNIIGFLDLVEPSFFAAEFNALLTPGRSPGEALNAFSCTFFSLCDVSKTYAYTDVVSAKAIMAAPEAGLVRVRVEMQMWDGIFLTGDVFYDPATARLRASLP